MPRDHAPRPAQSFLGACFAQAAWIAILGGVAVSLLGIAPMVWPRKWLFDNLGFFQPQLLALGLAAIACGLIGQLAPHRFPRVYRLGLLALSLPAFSLGVAMGLRLLALPSAAPEISEGAGVPLRVVSINLERTDLRGEALTAFLTEARPDVLILQETAWQAQAETLAASTGTADIAGVAPYPHFRHSGALGDITVFSRYPLEDVREETVSSIATTIWSDDPREILSFRVNPAGAQEPASTQTGSTPGLTIVAVHPESPRSKIQHADRGLYLSMVGREVANRRKRSGLGEALPLAVIGDWNTAPWSTPFGEFLTRFKLGTRFPGGFPQTTRFFYNWHLRWLLGATVDHVAVSAPVAIRQVGIGPDIGSDHVPLVVDLLLPR